MKKVMLLGTPVEISFAKKAPAWVPLGGKGKLGVCQWFPRCGWRIWVFGKMNKEMQKITLGHEFAHCLGDVLRWAKDPVAWCRDDVFADNVGCMMVLVSEIFKEIDHGR